MVGRGDELQAGARDYERLAQRAGEALRGAGFEPDYVAIRAPDLGPPDETADSIVILAAARLGQARLIDNLTVSLTR